MWGRLTDASLAVLALSAMLAKNDGSSYVEPRHILSALATDDRNGLASILKRHGYRTSAICSQPTVMQHFPHALPSFSQSATVMIELASDLAIRRGEIITAPAHIALALLRSKDEEVERTLLEQGVDVAATMRDILHDLGGSDIIVEIFGEQYDALKWSQEAQRIIAGAHYESTIFRTDYIGSEHILLSLLRDSDNTAAQFLENFYAIPISIGGVPVAVKEITGAGGRTMFNRVRFTVNANRIITESQLEARRSERAFVGSEHVLLAILANPGSAAARALSKRISLDRLKQDLRTTFDTH